MVLLFFYDAFRLPTSPFQQAVFQGDSCYVQLNCRCRSAGSLLSVLSVQPLLGNGFVTTFNSAGSLEQIIGLKYPYPFTETWWFRIELYRRQSLCHSLLRAAR
jgi:hypothetical protein